jgi:hypothetical protein
MAWDIRAVSTVIRINRDNVWFTHYNLYSITFQGEDQQSPVANNFSLVNSQVGMLSRARVVIEFHRRKNSHHLQILII